MNIVESLFGRSKTPAERLRAHQRALQKAQRELDRERSKLEVQEKKLVADIKKSAKEGQMNACKIQAKDLVRTRRNVQKFYQMRTQLQAVSLRIQTLRSTTQMGEAMKGATKAMGTMNRTLNLPAVSKIMRDFERESEVMDMKEEMMGEADWANSSEMPRQHR
ncbi:snf7-domain-containing protein [Ceraceosorus bombacis]|uniref:Snf7-domain-containing protein n=1 Tax=Ceraceosorus bombacis TaxID=401625 RepID=A0A0P1BH74_9BASI|nr:snf7-domain-containing protein [Ceraceosorus bombacis]